MRGPMSERVYISGFQGFLGRAVTSWFTHAIDYRGSVKFRSVDGVNSSRYDLLDPVDCRKLFHEFGQTLFVHLAAFCGGIGKNAASPAQMWSDNIRMGMNVIDLCVATLARPILLGSVCSYPRDCPVPFKESDLFNGYPDESNAPYGIAKRSLLTYAQACAQQYGLKFAYLIPANLFGPHDHFEGADNHVIPAMIRKFSQAVESGAKSVTLWGSGRPTRDFLYVEDCAEAIVKAADRIDILPPYPINISTGAETSIADLARDIAGLCGFTGEILWDHEKPDGQPRRCVDPFRADKLLDWQARTPLLEGLRKTVAWYRDNKPSADYFNPVSPKVNPLELKVNWPGSVNLWDYL